jgi:hypothetical protein
MIKEKNNNHIKAMEKENKYEKKINKYKESVLNKNKKLKEKPKVLIKEKVKIKQVRVIKINVLNEFNISLSERISLEGALCKEIKSLTAYTKNIVSVSKEHPNYSTLNYYIVNRKNLLRVYNKLKGNTDIDMPIYGTK